MTHWQQLPDTLDPDVRRLVEQLRLLKDRSGRSLQALAGATACSKSAWQRYLNGAQFISSSITSVSPAAFCFRPDSADVRAR